ncbi:hypothetical protein REPUB_Repub12eG0121800 [Reevesia pubescens]
MAKVGIPILFLFSMFLVALPNDLPPEAGQVAVPVPVAPPRPLCASQFALVNYACAIVPLVPMPPPPPPPSPPESGHGNGHRHGQSHTHRHRHRRAHHATREQQYCCRWLNLVDNECVCDILVRLPVFLSRPNHQYTVVVDESCIVTFSCAGRLAP